MFEEQYTDLSTAVDDLAERIRALGHYAPGSFKEFSDLTAVKEESERPDWQTMVRRLAEDQETVVNTCRDGIKVAGEIDDVGTEDLLTERLKVHEKNAWMLRAHLDG